MPQVTEAMIRERQQKNELGSILAREGIPQLEEDVYMQRKGLVNELIESQHIHQELDKINKELSSFKIQTRP